MLVFQTTLYKYMRNLILFFIILLTSACDKSTSTFEKLSPDAVVLAFGDSLTYGTGSSKDSNYPRILSKFSFHNVINAGIPGEITRDALSRLPSLLDEHKPELLILIHGGNDILKKIPQQQIINNLTQMITEAKQRGINVIMMGVPEPKLFLMDSAELYAQIAEQQQVPIDLTTLPKILGTASLKSDLIHPNNEGYKILAESLLNMLISTGAL